jgi:hypothetical protein
MSTNRGQGDWPFDEDENESILGYGDPAWQEKWAPACPGGNRRRLVEILGFRPKAADLLQLRVVLRAGDHGVCRAIIDEHPDRIYVRALACLHENPCTCDAGRSLSREVDCPCNVWLDAPLDERFVIDIDSGQSLPVFIPAGGSRSPPSTSHVRADACLPLIALLRRREQSRRPTGQSERHPAGGGART